MPAGLHSTLLVAALRLVRMLPPPVRRALDAWSLKVARRRALQRQLKWQEQKARAAATFPAASHFS
jgi:hypothetical protein